MNFNNIPKRKYAGRRVRIAIASKWIKTYNGKNLIKGYAKWFGVDKLCAIRELQMLGVEISEEREKQIVDAHNRMIEERRKKKEEKERKEQNELGLFGSDEYFAFIAGYTSGGAAYGITWEEWHQQDEGKELDETDDKFDDVLPW